MDSAPRRLGVALSNRPGAESRPYRVLVTWSGNVHAWGLVVRVSLGDLGGGMEDAEDAAVFHFGHAVGVAVGAVVVRHDDHGAARVAGGVAQQIHHLVAGGGIERGGGLIADDERRRMDERAGDGDALLLSAGEPGGALLGFFGEADAGKDLACGFFGYTTRAALNEERDGDVFRGGERGDEVELLENEADVAREGRICTEGWC